MQELIVPATKELAKQIRAVLKPRLDRRKLRQSAEQSLHLAGAVGGLAALEELSDSQLSSLLDYLISPDIEHVSHQVYVARALEHRGENPEALLAASREELRLGLKHRTELEGGVLFEIVELVFRNILLATQAAWDQLGGAAVLPATIDFAIAGRLTAAAIRNTELLSSVQQITEFHRFERELRSQVASLHSTMRLPHAGVSRAVQYSKLYVQPNLVPFTAGHSQGDEPEPDDIEVQDVVVLGRKLVILGAPGAGKSTFVSKLAYDLASQAKSIEGPPMVPLVLLLREIADDLSKGGSSVLEYIEERCRDPYNIAPPPQALDYLLLNGRAVVVFDGLDELVDTSLRTKVVRLIEGFIFRYPLAPVIVTSRRVGYEAAPIDDKVVDVAFLADFNEDQVKKYASNWFDLDDSIPSSDRQALKASFVRDSEMVDDLRKNPLMLSLLCSMYATERYIPRNRPDVFEKCATMLFERWDRMRGVGGTTPFGSYVRSAVQHLAWVLFTQKAYGGAMPRRELVRELAGEFFGKRHQDYDLAKDEAEKFLDFCTGRAWVLTDVGATDIEPRYGFVHRTFLEFFAAEHLVRTRDSSPRRVLQTLGKRLEQNEWETVAQLGLQILDRNISSGADKFIRALVMRAKRVGTKAAANLLGFAMRSEQFATLSVPTTEALVGLMFEHEKQIPDTERYRSLFREYQFRPAGSPFNGLFELLSNLSDENAAVVARVVRGILLEHVDDEESIAAVCYVYHVCLMCPNENIREIVTDPVLTSSEAIQSHAETNPAFTFYRMLASSTSDHINEALEAGLGKFGGALMYSCPKAPHDGASYAPLVYLLLEDQIQRFANSETFRVIDSYLSKADNKPWVTLKTTSVRSEINTSVGSRALRNISDADPDTRRVMLALLLPYIEVQMARGKTRGWESVAELTPLIEARSRAGSGQLDISILMPEPSGAQGFLQQWAAGERSTFRLHYGEAS
ncbi:hypothetical protein LUPAC06_04399 [Micromonospora saelicesensis]|uniref:NACHT domain-containing protein n=1 Tax=Micromonospora saelicesensis TaxID=285676 RepID=UPI000DBF580B|nr:NACHT domain-containing protein [Micromonospora saelicesensis]RAO55097.1 hypothetical protein LUPAC06_04399 [Micromonospora saelicesensis]